jgi:phage terminase large subunit GpA-like protein
VKDDPFLLPDFVNNVLAETWKESEFKPDENQLLLLAQEFEQWPRGHINKNVLFLTLQADIQKDRIEAGLMGWGRNRQGYMIDYWTFEGNPSMVENQTWKELREKLTALYRREDGQEMRVQIALIDSQYLSDTVDLFCDSFDYNPFEISGVYPMQSRETQDKLVKEFKSNIKTPVIGIHDQEFKRALYNILRKRPQGPGMFPGYYLHFSHEYGPEFYKQLTAEEIIQVKIKGVVKGVKILNTKQRRNEVHDIVKMGMAAFQLALDKYFDILNTNRKLQKLPEVQEDAGLFFDFMEESLFD